MSHPEFCVVVEAHDAKDCHRSLIEGEKCQARIWIDVGWNRSRACGKPAKGWRRMTMRNSTTRPQPSCGIHLRAKYDPVAHQR